MELEKNPIFQPGDNLEKNLQEKNKRKQEVQKQIEELQKNIAILPLLKEEEEKFLAHFKDFIQKL